MEDLKKQLIKDAKTKGLDIAEESLKDIAEFLFESLAKIATRTENKYDDLLIPLLSILRPAALKMIDKLDGEEG